MNCLCIFLDGVTENENKDLSTTHKKNLKMLSYRGSLQNYTKCSKLVKALVTGESLLSIREHIPKKMLENNMFVGFCLMGPSFLTRKSITREMLSV